MKGKFQKTNNNPSMADTPLTEKTKPSEKTGHCLFRPWLLLMMVNTQLQTTRAQCATMAESIFARDQYQEGLVFKQIAAPLTFLCAQQCLQRSLCHSFNYFPGNSSCQLNLEPLGPDAGQPLSVGVGVVYGTAQSIYHKIAASCVNHTCQPGSVCVPVNQSYVCDDTIDVFTPCGPPTPVPFTSHVTTGQNFGHLVTYTCLPGYSQSGATQAVCRFNGVWTNPSIRCDSNDGTTEDATTLLGGGATEESGAMVTPTSIGEGGATEENGAVVTPTSIGEGGATEESGSEVATTTPGGGGANEESGAIVTPTSAGQGGATEESGAMTTLTSDGGGGANEESGATPTSAGEGGATEGVDSEVATTATEGGGASSGGGGAMVTTTAIGGGGASGGGGGGAGAGGGGGATTQETPSGDCGAPPEIPGTTKSFTATSVGSSVSYTCLQGWESRPPSPLTLTCQSNTQWSTYSIFPCSPTQCTFRQPNGRYVYTGSLKKSNKGKPCKYFTEQNSRYRTIDHFPYDATMNDVADNCRPTGTGSGAYRPWCYDSSVWGILNWNFCDVPDC